MAESPSARRLEGRVCLITGGAHGLGRAYGQRLAAEGARIAVADIDEPAARQAAEDLRAAGHDALAVAVDVANEESTSAMARAVVDHFGRIDVLINNAAIFATIPISRVGFQEITPEEWDRVMTVNVKGVWLCCRAVVPYMRQQEPLTATGVRGKIITIGSGTVLAGAPTRSHYVASKGAVLAFTRTLARELGPDGITVNLLSPGSTLSEQDPPPEILAMRQRDTAGRAIARVELPSDLVGPMAFLASADSDFMTGQVVNVDGGANMY
jgi:3-oxoacyl-[acyl-carrier protein] reductase